jgi:hypothetical protein
VAQVLRDAGIAIRETVAPALFPTGLFEASVPALLIPVHEQQRAATVLEEIGLTLAYPLVDKSEPMCPVCSAALDPYGPAECPFCGLRFDWVDIDQRFTLPAGSRCTACGYDISESTSPTCPECEAEILARPRATTDPLIQPRIPGSSSQSLRKHGSLESVSWAIHIVIPSAILSASLGYRYIGIGLGAFAILLVVATYVHSRYQA